MRRLKFWLIRQRAARRDPIITTGILRRLDPFGRHTRESTIANALRDEAMLDSRGQP